MFERLSHVMAGAMFVACTMPSFSSGQQLEKSLFVRVAQSSNASSTNTASRAVDGNVSTVSLTANAAGSYWLAELGRPFRLDRIEVVNRPAPNDTELEGLTLRLFNIDDQVVFQTGITNPGAGATWAVNLPADTRARSVRIGLDGNQTNGAGNYRVGLAEVRLFGDLALPYGPAPYTAPTNVPSVFQSSEYPGYPASNALDGDPSSFTHTADLPNSYWMADLKTAYPIQRVELVNRSQCCDARMSGLVLRILDGASNTTAMTTVTNPGLGKTWSYSAPVGTTGQYIRVGLENNQTNGGGNYYVTLAEARAFSGGSNLLAASRATAPATNNLASFKNSYMVRFSSSQAPASNANDDNASTETKTTMQTVDGYWEVDLGATYALYGVRTIGASGIGSRLTNTTVRLYDAAHESVFAKRLSGTPDVFDSDLNGPVFARFVRVGLEDKQRTDPSGGLEWYIGMREVEVFGRTTNTVGILNFSASAQQINPGESTTLSWQVEDVRRVEIHPAVGSVGEFTLASGLGSITLTPTQSTEYILVASNAAGVFTRAVSVQVGSDPLPVRLSELVAENKFSLRDGYGDSSDWIELRNTANTTVKLSGYGLSDDPALPMKWVFPVTNLAPHATLIVYASGRATPVDAADELHANFQLSKEGGPVVLTAPNGVATVDSLAYPELDTDLAFGRDLEGALRFLEPTPGVPNTATSYAGWLRPLAFSHPRGFYQTPFALTLTNSNAGATAYYSLDGSVPSIAYSSGISINNTKSVRAWVTRAGWKPPRIQTRTYLFIDSVITSPVMRTSITQDARYAPRMRPALLALPSVSMVVPSEPNYDEQEGSIEILWPDGTPPLQANAGLARFGGSWQTFAKKSFRAKFRARYGDSKLHAPLFNRFDHGVLARTSFDEMEFRGGNQDMVDRGFYMASRFVEDSMLDMGSLNPHGRFVHLYLNGVYWGQYDAHEPLTDHLLADYLGGAQEDYVNVRGNDNLGSTFVLGTPDPPNILPWQRVVSLKGSYLSVRPYLDVSHLIDFTLLWIYGDCEAEFRAAGPLTAGTGFKFWISDADGFLRTSATNLNKTADVGPAGIYGGLMSEGHSDFKTLLADRIYRHYFNDGALTPAKNDARLAARLVEINDSLIAECARWGYRTPANWASAALNIRSNLFPVRSTRVVSQLRLRGLYPAFDPPAFDRYGGLVTNGFRPQLSSASGTIYYTLDGSDPRLPGGTVSPNAKQWTLEAVTISEDATILARVRSPGGQWSALSQPRFLLASRVAPAAHHLLITEIHYNPADGDKYEFVELANVSTNLLDLSGFSLAGGVRFIFPNGYALAPGSFVVVVEDAAAFAQRYQNPASPWYWPGINVAGEWVGALDDSGETLSIVASNGVVLSSVFYKTSGDWPERANGRGSSAELRALPASTNSDDQVRAFVADGRNWTSSSRYHGSPGRLESLVKSVRINEVLSHTDLGGDWVELSNTGEQAVSLQDCYLTDNLEVPLRYAFPAGTVLEPGQFLVLPQSQLGFGLSELGDDLSLLRANGTNVIEFLDTVDFPAVNREESLGLFARSDGVVDFTELRATTPASANALPRVGPVVISEIMSAPAAGLAQFIELASITNSAVPLYDPARPTNVWVIEGVGLFAFPTRTVISPCSTIIVCSTNPDAFRMQYGVSASVPVFGPWTGALDADGETLKLLRPGDPEPDGTVPYYRVDHVSYRSLLPWPQAGSGASIEKLPIEAYGNDPAYWRASLVNGTPGVPCSNRPPAIVLAGTLMVDELTPMTWSVAAVDLDFPWQSAGLWPAQLPPGSTFDPATGLLQWTPSEAQGPGIFTAAFAAADNASCDMAQMTNVFSLTVNEVNQAPVWAPQPDVQVAVGASQTLQLNASDPDLPQQTLQYQATGLPDGFSFDTATLRIAGSGVTPGVFPVSIIASDSEVPSLSATNQFTIRITGGLAVSIEAQPGAIRITFPGTTGMVYWVEYTDSLAAPNWQLLQEINGAQTNLVEITDFGVSASTHRFYRIKTVPDQNGPP